MTRRVLINWFVFSNGVFYYVHYRCFDSNYHDSCSSRNPRQKQRLLTLPYQKLSKQSAPLVSKCNKLVAWNTLIAHLFWGKKKGGELLQEDVKEEKNGNNKSNILRWGPCQKGVSRCWQLCCAAWQGLVSEPFICADGLIGADCCW